ncbi:MAG: FKBP-type peptidyl-prolyl cis-trans isomerase N-terminal domain-containing protein [Pseudomonadota bacterium]
MIKQLFAAIALCSLMMLPHSIAAEEDFANEEARLSYGLGVLIGEQIRRDFDSVDFDSLLEGIKAQHAGGETRLSLQEASLAVQGYQTQKQHERNAKVLAESQTYLQDNAIRAEVTTTESGLQYEVLQAADGPKPAATDTVSVHYRGTLVDGT